MALPEQPTALSPQFCFSTTALRDFLRLSRSSVDDTISQNLNGLVMPSRAGFDPISTSQRTTRWNKRSISKEGCKDFIDKVLFPTWNSRARVLEYCAAVASSPDPDDPEAALRDLQSKNISNRVVDERLDPYSGKSYLRESRRETLTATLRQEAAIEGIVCHRTWEVVQDHCEALPKDWKSAIEAWRKNT